MTPAEAPGQSRLCVQDRQVAMGNERRVVGVIEMVA